MRWRPRAKRSMSSRSRRRRLRQHCRRHLLLVAEQRRLDDHLAEHAAIGTGRRPPRYPAPPREGRPISAPILMTMSISRAPSKIAAGLVAFHVGGCRAERKPDHGTDPVELPLSRRAATATHAGLTQTVANPNCAASRQSTSISCRVASGFRSVWSIIAATLAGAPPAAWTPTRVAPASSTPWRRSGQQSVATAWHGTGIEAARTLPQPPRRSSR